MSILCRCVCVCVYRQRERDSSLSDCPHCVRQCCQLTLHPHCSGYPANPSGEVGLGGAGVGEGRGLNIQAAVLGFLASLGQRIRLDATHSKSRRSRRHSERLPLGLTSVPGLMGRLSLLMGRQREREREAEREAGEGRNDRGVR